MSRARQALADTSVVIDPRSVTEHADELAVSVVTIAELRYGITADDDLMEQQRRRSRVQDALDRFEVLPFDLAATEFYGTLCTLVRQHGRSPRGRRLDLMIAATAAQHDLPLLTRNAEDFAGLDTALTVVDLDGAQ
ncbi:MAG: type II toxin-antitoxin system VapC family toxin [Sciscionella sp.]